MTEQPAKPESSKRELSIDEFLEVLDKKFNADKDLLSILRIFLEKNLVSFFKSNNLAEKFFQQQVQWSDKEIMPLYDRGLDMFFTLKMGGHTYLRAFLYAFKKSYSFNSWKEIRVQGQYLLADKWTEEKMGWYVSGGDFSLVKAFDYRGTKQEEEIFQRYMKIQNLLF